MNPSPFTTLNSIVGLALLCACGGSDRSVAPPPPPPPLVAANVAVTSGNNQSANIKHVLPLPLVVTVTTSTGAPIPGATVDWEDRSGYGFLYPPSGSLIAASTTAIVTDANGQASVTLNVGPSPRSHAVVATVRGTNLEARFDELATAPIILHYDGTSWSVALEDTFGGIALITSVSGVAPAKAVAGGFGCSDNQILSYDGTAWSAGCRVLSGGPVVRSIGANSPNDVFAVETLGRPLGYPSYIAHFDGQLWSVVYNHKTGTARLPDLHAVGTRAGDDVIAVGDSGTMVHFSGGESWTLQQSGTTKNLQAVWLDRASSTSFVVGDGGTILYSNGSGWGAHTSGTTQSLYAVWGTSPSDVFAVGDGGTILHYDGVTWTAQSSGTTQSLRGVWGDASGSVFAVGVASTILHYDGTTWTAHPIAASMDIFGVWGTSGTNVFAVGGPR